MRGYASRSEFRRMSRGNTGRSYLDEMLRSVSVVPLSSYRGRSAARRVKRDEWPWLFFTSDSRCDVNRFYMYFMEIRYSNSVARQLVELPHD